MREPKKLTMVCTAAALLLAAGCTKSNEPVATKTKDGSSTAASGEAAAKRDNAQVRVVHAHSGAGAADIYAGDLKTFESVDYKSVTSFKELPGDRTTFRVRMAGKDATTEALAENSEGLMDGQRYTVIALADDELKPTLRVIRDDLAPPAMGKAKVRVIHASPGTGEVDLYAAGKADALFDGINFNTSTNWNDVDPMKGTLEIRPEGKKVAALRIPNVDLEAGKIYTFVVVGGGKSKKKLEAVPIVDTPLAAARG